MNVNSLMPFFFRNAALLQASVQLLKATLFWVTRYHPMRARPEPTIYFETSRVDALQHAGKVVQPRLRIFQGISAMTATATQNN